MMEDELPVAGGGMMNEGRMWIVRSSDRAYSIPGSRADPASLTTCFGINSEKPRGISGCFGVHSGTC